MLVTTAPSPSPLWTRTGKTVLSSYVTLRAEKILFVVPTEPLVWQVAAMFHHVLGGEGGKGIHAQQPATACPT
jgi:ERCC4-related helicase